jgi:hypothetical protein
MAIRASGEVLEVTSMLQLLLKGRGFDPPNWRGEQEMIDV